MAKYAPVRGLIERIKNVTAIECSSLDLSTLRVWSQPFSNPLLLNSISFFLLSLIAFRANSAYLFYGSDGRYEITLLTESTRFVPLILSYTNNFIQSLGNIWFAFNPRFIPSYILSISQDGVFTNFALSFAISAVELFLATYLSARLAGGSRIAALAAAWLLPLVTYRYVQWGLIPTTFSSFPHYATIAGLSAVMAGLLLRLDSRRVIFSLVVLGLFFLGISYIVLVAPTLIILVVPELAIFGLVSLLSNRNRGELVFKVLSFGGLCAACLLAGYFHFMAGLVSYTAADTFKGLSTRPAGLQEVSMLFWSASHPFFTIERTFVGLGLVGAMWTAWRSTGLLRLTAIAFLGTVASIIAVGILHYHYHFWYGPAFWYFEGFLFPYHAIFASILFWEIIRIGLSLAVSPSRLATLNPVYARDTMIAAATILMAIVPWIYIRHEQRVAPPQNLPYYVPYPQAESPITKILKKEISLSPGSAFRGREATFLGRMFPESESVDISGLWGIPRYLATYATGNSHDGAGLWQDSIPTLLEYNPLMTPPYFAFARSFFTEPVDLQIRNLVAMRHIDPRLLAAVGVRFVITDRPYDGRARLWQTLEVPVSETYLKWAGIPQNISSFSLYLYELSDVNVGQYSPTEPRVVRTASEMLGILGDPAIDLGHTFVVAEPFLEKLSVGTLRAFLVESGQYTVTATSSGHSVLILPMEYSRCLHLAARGPSRFQARLFRADLLMTGIIFDGELDATISYRTGPWSGSRCRLRDKDDMDAIEMNDAFKDKPQLVPRGMDIR